MMTEEFEKKKKNDFIKNFEFLKNKKVQWAITIVLMSLILVSSFQLRITNLELLKDETTGKYIPADPDACYELRTAQVLLDKGNLEGIDEMRNPGLNLGFTQEMLPRVLALSYKILNPINPNKFTLDYIDVMYPNIAFLISAIIFFFLVFYLTKSKFAGILSSAILAYSPQYLSRTMTGVSSHEALGMPFFFLAILIFAYSLNNFYKNKKSLIILGILTGISFAASVLSWAGASNFAMMIIPMSILVYYLFNIETKEKEDDKKKTKKKIWFIAFNAIWIISSILVMPLFSNSFSTMIGKLETNYGILIIFSLIFIFIDTIIEKYSNNLKFIKEKQRIFFSLIITIILGVIGLFALGKNPFNLIYGIYHQLLYPMGQGRVGLTVAYYSQPYLTDIINQYTPFIFWIFFLGIAILGFNISKKVKNKKERIYFNLSWIFIMFGLTFTRYSPSSLFNGVNFISQLLYFSSFIILFLMFIWLYYKKEFEIEEKDIVLFSLTIVMLLSMRSAVRVLFLIYTFVAMILPYGLIEIGKFQKKTKDDLLKMVLIVSFVIIFAYLIIFLFGNPFNKNPGTYQISSYSARYMGPIADSAWQNAMAWVRNNTRTSDIFIHWWDYGYQIQLLANRTTVLDGGNANAYWNHLMGRYGLTETNPNASLSFMKTHNVSYLLIEPTDLGKYPAYSKIGSDDNWDRFSYIPSFSLDSSQTQEKANSTIIVYTGVAGVDEDLIIENRSDKILIPGPIYDNIGNPEYKAYIIGILIETKEKGNKSEFLQPSAVLFYNNQQIKIPMRYLYANNQIVDYKTGIDSIFFIYPSISSNSISAVGSGLYLSPKVSKSLFAKLYLMNDPFNEYSSLKLKVSEDSKMIKLIKENGISLGEFVDYNGNFEGPVKIWEVSYPDYIKENAEFMNVDGRFGEFDNLNFTTE